jgi:hypothetical protein
MKNPGDWVSWLILAGMFLGSLLSVVISLFAPKSWGGADPYP